MTADRCYAAAAHVLAKLSALRRLMVRRDKKLALENKAAEAQKAANAGHSKKVYAIARGLSGATSAPLAAIKSLDGRVLTDRDETQERWRQHFTDVFRATRESSVADLQAGIQHRSPPNAEPVSNNPPAKKRRTGFKPFSPSVNDVFKALMRCNGDKGLGPDQCSARVLQAGRWPLAEHIHRLITWAIDHEYVPVAWRGGKLVVLYKGKGSPQDVDSYRGLLISSHVAKVFTSLVQQYMKNAYIKQVGGDQLGAVARRGTSLAVLALRCFVDMCMHYGLSAMVLFVDLNRPSTTPSARSHLASLKAPRRMQPARRPTS